MQNKVQLITYVDRLSGGGLVELDALLAGPLRNLFGGVHLLPFFDPIDGADAGFDPIDHTRVDPRLGGWSDVEALASRIDVIADLIVNHISRDSPQFRDFHEKGSRIGVRRTVPDPRPRLREERERGRRELGLPAAARSAFHRRHARGRAARDAMDYVHAEPGRHRRYASARRRVSRANPANVRPIAASAWSASTPSATPSRSPARRAS